MVEFISDTDIENVPGALELMELVVDFKENFEHGWDIGLDEDTLPSTDEEAMILITEKFRKKVVKCKETYKKIELFLKANPSLSIESSMIGGCNSIEESFRFMNESVIEMAESCREAIRRGKENKKQNKDSMFVLVLDTETTGLQSHDEVISLGAILLEVSASSGNLIREVESYYGLREPSVPINPMAAKVHGLKHKELIGKYLDVDRLDSMFKKADLFAAHNAQFDYKMLIKIYPSLAYETWGCTCLGLRDFWSKLPNRKLDTICDALNVVREEPHNALSDCRALVEVLFKSKSKHPNGTPYMRPLVNRPWMPYPD